MNTPTDQRGFSLLEVMMALVLFTLGIMASALIYQAAMESQKESALRLKAVHYAEERMEQVLSLPFEALKAMRDSTTDPPYVPPGYSLSLWKDTPEGLFTRTLSLSGNSDVLITIDVTVRWDEGDVYTLSNSKAAP